MNVADQRGRACLVLCECTVSATLHVSAIWLIIKEKKRTKIGICTNFPHDTFIFISFTFFETWQCYDVLLILMEEQTSFSLFIYIFFCRNINPSCHRNPINEKTRGRNGNIRFINGNEIVCNLHRAPCSWWCVHNLTDLMKNICI